MQDSEEDPVRGSVHPSRLDNGRENQANEVV